MSQATPVSQGKLKRLFWDIEVSPNVVFSWRIGSKVSLLPDNIIAERKVISICWKWEGEKQVHALWWSDDQDDRDMLEKFAIVAEEADEIIAHFGDGFDMPWFRTRCLIQGLAPLPLYKTVDTKAWASKYFYFNSNKLDYLGEILGHGNKLDTDFELWRQVVLFNNRERLAYMVKYNKRDVIQLEKVWNDLRFCVQPKTHAGVFQGSGKWTCAHCGSEDVRKSKTRVTAHGVVRHQMRCNKCHSYYIINSIDYEKYQKETRKVPACQKVANPEGVAKS